MKQAILIHNPTAGSGEHDKKDLVKEIEFAGYEVKYYSTDIPGWEGFVVHETDVIFVAGGDGTVQKLTAELLKAGNPFQKIPIQVLPLGTANNIATSLDLNMPFERLVKLQDFTGFDIGVVEGAGEAGFFIEGLGFGIIPRLVKVMEDKKQEGRREDPGTELRQSLQELLMILTNYKACEAIILADGEKITGKFLLVELMNTRFIGPNFEFAANSSSNDGFFELVLVPEHARKDLEEYINDLLNNKKRTSLHEFVFLKKVQEIRLKWLGGDMHIDDERIEAYNGEEVKVKNIKAAFKFRIQNL